MNTQEAIMFVRGVNPEYYTKDMKKEIIDLLECGEKYKKIVEEIDERLMPGKVNAVECPDHTNMGDLSTLDFVRLVIKDIKKKYFPQEANQDKDNIEALVDLLLKAYKISGGCPKGDEE